MELGKPVHYPLDAFLKFDGVNLDNGTNCLH